MATTKRHAILLPKRELAVILGVRPHYIKAAGLVDLLRGTQIKLRFLDIQQHYDPQLRAVFLRQYLLDVIPLRGDYSRSATQFDFFSNALQSLRRWLKESGKNIENVLVMGDANPALIGALAATKLGRRVIHLEAGVRRSEAEKEHWNTAIVDVLSSLRFCYSSANFKSLEKEGLSEGSYIVGDIFARWLLALAKKETMGISRETGSCLVTIHRPQNCSEVVIRSVLNATRLANLSVIWLLHPRLGGLSDIVKSAVHVQTLPPQGHREIIRLIAASSLVITDSGGLSRESMVLGGKTIILHEHGMWEAAIERGAAIRSDAEESKIRSAINRAIGELDPTLGRQEFLVEGGAELFVEMLRKTME